MEMAYLWGGKHGPTQSLFHTVLKHKGGTKQKRSLCIFQLFIFRESAGFYQVIVDAVGLDSIYQFQHCQTGADLLVLIGTVRLHLRKQNCVFLPHVLTNIRPRLTLKLEILVDFPASANVLLTQFTMMPSDLSPPPSSSSTFNVYLEKDNWQSDQSWMLLDNNPLQVRSFTFSSAATPAPGSGLGRQCSGHVRQFPQWRNLPICPKPRHSYSSPTSGRK